MQMLTEENVIVELITTIHPKKNISDRLSMKLPAANSSRINLMEVTDMPLQTPAKPKIRTMGALIIGFSILGISG